MQSLRRVALRAASSAVAATPKSQAVGVVTRFAAANVGRIVAVPAARFFSSSVSRFNEAAESDEMTTSSTGSAPNESDFQPEANGVYGVFIWNIPYRATEREMFDTFTRFGKVHSLNIGRDARGLSRGFAFIYYQDKAHAMEAVKGADGAFWQGRRIGSKAKTPGDNSGQISRPSKPKSNPSSSLYVGNIPYEATDSELNQLFSGLNNVLDVRVAIDKATGWPRGFAHADFSDVDSATRALEKLSETTIQGRTLRVDYSESKRSNTGPSNNSETPGPGDRVL